MAVSRRALLLGGGSAALAVAAGTTTAFAQTPAPAPPPGEPGVTGTLRLLGDTAPVRAEQRLTHLGLSWSGEPDVGLRVRVGSDWQAVPVRAACGGGRDDRPGRRRSALVAVPDTGEYTLDMGTDTPVRVGEINTMAEPKSASGPRSEKWDGGLVYRTRAGWGADEGLRFSAEGTELFPPTWHPVQTLTVHHSATQNNDPNPASTVRGIYYDHTVTREFGDLGYHLLIDEAGALYEGRWSGDDQVPVFGGASTHKAPLMANAAHVGGFNAGNVGVVLLGDLVDVEPTSAALDTLLQVLTVLTRVCRLDPTGTTDYVNPISGATATVPTISGHQDWEPTTECPGDKLHAKLPEIRKRIAAAVA
jgi:hypothetical protein